MLEAHAASGYLVAVDMLTRTGEASDFAPDASVFAAHADPKTGGRRLEELAFEVADRQALAVPTSKARELVRRGVRRVFCLLVGKGRLLEWSRETAGWQPVGPSAALADRCFAQPLPVRALLEAAASDEAVVAALRARRVPALEALLAEGEAKGRAEGEAKGRAEGKAEGRAEGEAKGRAEGKAEGHAEGKAEGEAAGARAAVADLCEVLGIDLGAKRRARLAAMGVSELETLRAALKKHRRWPPKP
jgi:hypothetical protein